MRNRKWKEATLMRKQRKKPNSRFVVRDVGETKQYIRLNRYLAMAGVCSRRKADDLIQAGAVKVNGKVVKTLGQKIHISDHVTVHGRPVSAVSQKYVYILLHKPKDTITTVKDEKGRTTVVDLIKTTHRVFPVGRLDRNTTGALLLTNDGQLAYRLTHPRYQIPRVYSVTLDGPIRSEDVQKIAAGIVLKDGKTAPMNVIVDPHDRKHLWIEMFEGKNHEIKRIFRKLGYTVKKLHRKSFANLSIQGLRRGEYRFLTRSEINQLKAMVGLTDISIAK